MNSRLRAIGLCALLATSGVQFPEPEPHVCGTDTECAAMHGGNGDPEPLYLTDEEMAAIAADMAEDARLDALDNLDTKEGAK